jgi:hypothetical protein
MIPDRCGTVPAHAPRNSSAQIAADRVLHIQRFGLPLRLIAAAPAAPRSPPTAGHHAGAQPPPAVSPRRRGRAAAGPGSTRPYPPLGPGPARTGPVGQARQHRPAQPARAAPDRSPARHRSRHSSSRPDQSSAQACDRACSGESTCRPRRRSALPASSDWSYRKQMAASPTVIPPEYGPGTSLAGRSCPGGRPLVDAYSSCLGDCMAHRPPPAAPSHRQANAAPPRCTAVLG